MKTKRKYIRPRGRFVLITTEECLCSSSIGSVEFSNDSEAYIENWDEGSIGYFGQDL